MNRLRRNDLPRWEVRLDGKIIGRIEVKKIGTASATFFFAFGVHPDSGHEVRLEGDTDLEARVRTLVAFQHLPEAFSHHFSGYSGT